MDVTQNAVKRPMDEGDIRDVKAALGAVPPEGSALLKELAIIYNKLEVAEDAVQMLGGKLMPLAKDESAARGPEPDQADEYHEVWSTPVGKDLRAVSMKIDNLIGRIHDLRNGIVA